MAWYDAISEHFKIRNVPYPQGLQPIERELLLCESLPELQETLRAVMDKQNILPPICKATIGVDRRVSYDQTIVSAGNLELASRPSEETDLPAKSAEAMAAGTREVDSFWKRSKQKRRWRFVDPLYRRRRVKFLEPTREGSASRRKSNTTSTGSSIPTTCFSGRRTRTRELSNGRARTTDRTCRIHTGMS